MAQLVQIDGHEHEAADLNPEEIGLFNSHYDKLIAPLTYEMEYLYQEMRPGPNGDTPSPIIPARDFMSGYLGSSRMGLVQQNHKYTPVNEVAALFQSRRAHALSIVGVAKALLGGVFKGVDGRGPELSMALVRPWQMLRDQSAVETCSTGWNEFLADPGAPAAWADGDDFWVGFGGGNDEAVNIDKRFLVVLFGIAELGVNRPVQGVRFQIDQETFLPISLQPYLTLAPSTGRIPVMPIKTTLFTPKATVLGTVYTDAAVQSTLMPLGLVIGQSAALINHYVAAPVT